MNRFLESNAEFIFSERVLVSRFDESQLRERFKSYALKGVDFLFSFEGRLVLLEVKSAQDLDRANETFSQFLHTLLLLGPVWLRLPDADGTLQQLAGKPAGGKDMVLCLTERISEDRIRSLKDKFQRMLKRSSLGKMFNCRVRVVDIAGLNRIYSPAVTAKRCKERRRVEDEC